MAKQSDKPLSFQALILRLQNYWAEQGCVILQTFDTDVGAGTLHPATVPVSYTHLTMPTNREV